MGAGKGLCETHKRSREHASQQAWAQILALLVLGCTPWPSSSSPRLSFPICEMGIEMVSTSQDGYRIQRTSQI